MVKEVYDMVLIRQGYYKEMPHAEETDPSISEYIGKKIDYKKEICQYLQQGIVLTACGEVSQDVLHPEKGVAGTPDDMTDGKYIWPGDLAYYVKNYNLKLPDEFISTMKENDWKVSKTIDDMDFEKIVIDGVKI